MTVVMIANRSSPMVSFLAMGRAGAPVSKGIDLAGEPSGVLRELFRPFGRHFKTASTDALHGCTCKGYENMTRITIAALPIVEAIDGISIMSAEFLTVDFGSTNTFQQYFL